MNTNTSKIFSQKKQYKIYFINKKKCILPFLLYNGTELYKSKRNKEMYIRFIPGTFTNIMKCYNNVIFFPNSFFPELFYTLIIRPNSRIYIHSDFNSTRHELTYYMNRRLCVTETYKSQM